MSRTGINLVLVLPGEDVHDEDLHDGSDSKT